MALIVADRIKETTVTTGTGNVALAGAVFNFRALSAVCVNGDMVPYCIAHQTLGEWETGIGQWLTGGYLYRIVVLSSSNAGALVNFSAGTKDVFLTQPSAYMHPATLCVDGLHPEYVATIPTPNRAATATPAEYKHMSGFEFKTTAGAGITGGNYVGLHTISPWAGITTGGGEGVYQFAYCLNAPNDLTQPRIYFRTGIDATWNAWWSVCLALPDGTVPALVLTTSQVSAAVHHGTLTLDFGAWPGSNEASYTFSGQTECDATSIFQGEIAAIATTNHTALDSAFAAQLIDLSFSAPVAGVGPTLYARSTERMEGQFAVNWHWH